MRLACTAPWTIHLDAGAGGSEDVGARSSDCQSPAVQDGPAGTGYRCVLGSTEAFGSACCTVDADCGTTAECTKTVTSGS